MNNYSTKAGDPYVIISGGLVENVPTVPVFDLDVLKFGDESDIEHVQDMKAELEGMFGTQPYIDLCDEFLELYKRKARKVTVVEKCVTHSGNTKRRIAASIGEGGFAEPCSRGGHCKMKPGTDLFNRAYVESHPSWVLMPHPALFWTGR